MKKKPKRGLTSKPPMGKKAPSKGMAKMGKKPMGFMENYSAAMGR